MADWLSFWNRDSRRRNLDRHGKAVDPIFVPYGKGLLSRGDSIYCVGVEHGELKLITRIDASSLKDDPEQNESVLVRDSCAALASFARVVPRETVEALVYLHADDSRHSVRIDARGQVHGQAFQGRASIRRLVEGASALDALL